MSWLRTFRTQVLKMNQTALSTELVVDQGTLSKWERGLGHISPTAYRELQELVLEKTGIELPASWFFDPPIENVICEQFKTQMDGAAQ